MPDTSAEYYDTIERELYSAVVADVLDDLGYREQVMRYEIRPLYEGAKVVGRAATMLVADVFEMPAEPYKLELLDSVQPGEVLVFSTPSTRAAAIWGELLSTRTKVLGGRGAVIDGLTRDVEDITEMGFPVFCAGLSLADAKGRIDAVQIRCPVSVGGVVVQDGELVIADADGVVVVPAGAEEDAIARAREKVSGENDVRDRLRAGASLVEVFEDTGIL